MLIKKQQQVLIFQEIKFSQKKIILIYKLLKSVNPW